MPRRRQTTSKDKEPPKVLPNFQGTLKRMDAKAIVLEMDDYRVLEFRRNDKTKFFKNTEDAKPEIFNPGDRVSVEGEQDAEANLTAVNVRWEKAGDGKPAAKPDDGPTEEQIAAAEKILDEAKKHPRPAAASGAAPASTPAPERATETAPPPAPRDPEDPGPPKLQRGKPATRPASPAQAAEPERIAAVVETPAPPPAAAVAPSNITVERVDGALPEPRADAHIRKA